MAFVDFASATDAAAAMARLQGALLLSSEGAIHLEYARHKMAHNGWILAHEVCTRTIYVKQTQLDVVNEKLRSSNFCTDKRRIQLSL